MIITGLLGALTPTRYKWGFFTFGCVAVRPWALHHVSDACLSQAKAPRIPLRPRSPDHGNLPQMLWIFWVLAVPARKSASHLGTDFHRTYTSSALMLCVLWLVYPVIWAVCDGGNVITPTSEMVACESSGAFLEVLGTSGAARMALQRSRASQPSFRPFLRRQY